MRTLSHVFFFFNPGPARRVPIPTGIQRKLNFVSVRTIKEGSSSSARRAQPARAHRPPRPPHGSHLAPAALHALRSTLRWFRLVRGTNFSEIQFKYISNCNFVVQSVLSSEIWSFPGFESGRKFSDFFYFRHFLHS